MSYEPNKKKCATSETCSTPLDTTPWNAEWHPYKLSGNPAGQTLAVVAAETHWEPFAELHVKCERPTGEAPQTVLDLAECEEKAEELGRPFLNFDAAKKKCFTSQTCDEQKETGNSWQIYKRKGFVSAPSSSNLPETTSSAPVPALLWKKIAQPKMKCERPAGVSKKKVADLAACQLLAESSGSAYVNFEPHRLECFTSPTCAAPTETQIDWQIYGSYKWTTSLQPRMKCERPAGERPQEVADIAACQEKAEAEGREFMNFEEGRTLCYTSITCDDPVESLAYDWQGYKLDGPPVGVAQ